MKFRFDKKYAILFTILLAVAIIVFAIVENTVFKRMAGNVLIIALIYSFIQALYNFEKAKTIITIGIIALLIEISQAFDLPEKLGIQNNPVFTTIFGATFDVNDLWAYIAGCAVVYMLEFSNENKRPKKRKFF